MSNKESDEISSLYREAMLYEIGIDRQFDYDKAYELWDQAANLGDIYARKRCQEIENKGLLTKAPKTQAPESKNIKILFIDDDLSVRQLAHMVLEQNGYNTIFAENGEDALTKLSKHPDIKLVILDLNMPKMSGLHFLSYIRRMSMLEGVPIVICTGYIENELLKK